MILTKAVLTSAVGHSRMYSQNLDGWSNKTFWQNQARTRLEPLKWAVNSSYQSAAGPRRLFLVRSPDENRNLDASWTITNDVSSDGSDPPSPGVLFCMILRIN